MLKRFGVRMLTLWVTVILTGSTLAAQTRINFRPGASSTELTGSLAAKGKRVYLLNVAAGRQLTVEVTAGNRRVIVQINGAGYKVDNPEASNVFQGTLEGGEYRLTLYNEGRHTQYKMGVSVE